jgi:putative oxidoreductase
MKRLFHTYPNWGFTLLRLALAVIFFAHGSQKMLGWFGGPGLSGWIGFMASAHVPAFLAVLAAVAEFFGSIGLFIGFLTRIAAFGIGVNMVVAVLMVHLPNGFFMNWSGKQAGEGFEYHILIFTTCLVLMIYGGGAASVDNAIFQSASARP